MRKCIYSVITNNYDTLKEPLHNNPTWDFVCFTDDPTLKSDRWRVVLLNNPHGLSAKILSRRPKLLVHEYLPSYDLTLYVDACYAVTGDLDAFIETPLSEISLVIRDLNRSISDELKDLIKYKTIKPNSADKLIKFIEQDGFSITQKGTYYMGGLILRKNTDFVKMFNEAWWELLQLFERDQPALQYLLNKHNLKPGEYSTRGVRQYFSYHYHDGKDSGIIPNLGKTEIADPCIYYLTPADPNKKIGKVYNAHCEMVPNNNDWICIRDGDTMFLTSNWSKIIMDAVKRYPDTALFGCYTNRIGLDYQLTREEGFSENFDVKHHAGIAKARYEKYGSECIDVDRPVAGMFMLFRRIVWTRTPFKDELVVNNKFFDWDFGERILKMGGKIRLIQGLYLFHGYRLLTHKKDKSHLL